LTIFDKKYNKMIKQKLSDKRKERFTQEDFAFKLGMDTTNYNRRETGVTKISKREWDLMAKELDVKLEDIYEPEDGVYIMQVESASGKFSGSQNFFTGQDEFVFETMKKYIAKLEEENEFLKEQVKR
jgi:transcriptional regulator with XRE-family HTH domain